MQHAQDAHMITESLSCIAHKNIAKVAPIVDISSQFSKLLRYVLQPSWKNCRASRIIKKARPVKVKDAKVVQYLVRNCLSLVSSINSLINCGKPTLWSTSSLLFLPQAQSVLKSVEKSDFYYRWEHLFWPLHPKHIPNTSQVHPKRIPNAFKMLHYYVHTSSIHPRHLLDETTIERS